MWKNLILGLWLVTFNGCLLGCMTLTPTRAFVLNPATGEFRYESEQEEDLIVGQIVATENAQTGERSISVGTTTQPAITYGTRAVGVIDANARLILAEVEMAKTVGPNVSMALDSLANLAGALSWLRGGMSALPAGPTTATLAGKVESAQDAVANTRANLLAIDAAWRRIESMK
jgi:hypothetical protein